MELAAPPRVLGLTLAFVALGSTASAAPTFMGVGSLGGNSSEAFGVSADGLVVVGRSRSASGSSEAFRWTLASGMTSLGPGTSSSAWAPSGDGSAIVGTNTTGTGLEAFRWTQATGMVSLGVVGEAFGVSADGSVVVGGYDTGITDEAFRWTQGSGVVGLGGLSADFLSEASDVSADGLIAIGYAAGDVDEAFRWTQSGGMVGLGDLPGGAFSSFADAISADGSVIVGAAESGLGLEAFRWTESGGMVGLGDLPGGSFASWAFDVSGDGSVIVGRSSSASGRPASGYEAFIWDATNGMRELDQLLMGEFGLDITGWDLLSAEGISDDGRTIVGRGVNPEGQLEAWIAVIPEPSTALLVVLGTVGMAVWQRSGPW